LQVFSEGSRRDADAPTRRDRWSGGGPGRGGHCLPLPLQRGAALRGLRLRAAVAHALLVSTPTWDVDSARSL